MIEVHTIKVCPDHNLRLGVGDSGQYLCAGPEDRGTRVCPDGHEVSNPLGIQVMTLDNVQELVSEAIQSLASNYNDQASAIDLLCSMEIAVQNEDWFNGLLTRLTK